MMSPTFALASFGVKTWPFYSVVSLMLGQQRVIYLTAPTAMVTVAGPDAAEVVLDPDDPDDPVSVGTGSGSSWAATVAARAASTLIIFRAIMTVMLELQPRDGKVKVECQSATNKNRNRTERQQRWRAVSSL